MDWFLAAPFVHFAADQRLGAFVPDEAADLRFHAVPVVNHHDRSRKFTGSSAWADYFGHGNAVWRAARASRTPAGILTCFPQLSIPVGLRKRLALSDLPVVAWTFNLGKLPNGLQRHLAMAAFAAVDRFIVQSRSEIVSRRQWLGLPQSRFRFAPLQRAARPITVDEDRDEPFVLSMVSAQRDYRLLFGVLAELGYPAVIVAGAHAVAGLTAPTNVKVRSRPEHRGVPRAGARLTGECDSGRQPEHGLGPGHAARRHAVRPRCSRHGRPCQRRLC
jgi:hypothetical protein